MENAEKASNDTDDRTDGYHMSRFQDNFFGKGQGASNSNTKFPEAGLKYQTPRLQTLEEESTKVDEVKKPPHKDVYEMYRKTISDPNM